MEDKEVKSSEPQAEWIKPEVTEFDVNSTTLGGYVGTGTDNTYYS